MLRQDHEGDGRDQIDEILEIFERNDSPAGSCPRKGDAMRKGLITASIVLMGLSLYGIIESSRLERTMKMGVGIAFLPSEHEPRDRGAGGGSPGWRPEGQSGDQG